jgi:hypothetical protein
MNDFLGYIIIAGSWLLQIKEGKLWVEFGRIRKASIDGLLRARAS